jgi:dihydrofolate synthase/folylpolyglutamate synthase
MSNSAWRWLDSLTNYEQRPGYNFDLKPYKELLFRLGNPQEKLKNVILVAGTKGKGSTCALLDAGLRGCGISTGLYTSPHLLSVRERIQVSGTEIPEPVFARILTEIAEVARGLRPPPTYFEVLTTIAFLYFSENLSDYVILEVGLGGRLDATNVVHPLISVFTKIGLDHTDLLGDTIEAIAFEKAGIIHPGSVVVSAPQPKPAHQVLSSKASEMSAPFRISTELKAEQVMTARNGTEITIVEERKPYKVSIPILGRHQVENLLITWQILKELKREDARIREEKVIEGLKKVKLSARCQLISGNPPIILDAAHNPDSIAALRQTATELFPDTSPVIVFGVSKGKLIKEMIEILDHWPKLYILTQASTPRAESVTVLKEYLKSSNAEILVIPWVRRAAREGLNRAKDLLIITGSFFVAGEAINFLMDEGRLPKPKICRG